MCLSKYVKKEGKNDFSVSFFQHFWLKLYCVWRFSLLVVCSLCWFFFIFICLFVFLNNGNILYFSLMRTVIRVSRQLHLWFTASYDLVTWILLTLYVQGLVKIYALEMSPVKVNIFTFNICFRFRTHFVCNWNQFSQLPVRFLLLKSFLKKKEFNFLTLWRTWLML